MKNIISLLLACCLLMTDMPGWAQEPPDLKKARASYEEGVRHYYLADYAEALTYFKSAYLTKDDPAFLFNIAQCLRKLNRLNESKTFYRTYLRRAPDAINKAEVEHHLRGIEGQMATANPPIPKQFSAQDIAIVAEPQIDLSPQTSPAFKDHPLYKKWWFWTAAGVVAAGVTTTIIILTRHDPSSTPASILGSQKALP